MLPLFSRVLAKGQKREALSNLKNDTHGSGDKKSTLIIEFRSTYLSYNAFVSFQFMLKATDSKF